MRSGEVTWTPPQILQIVDAIKESWTLFLSSASGGIFASSLVVVLGWVSDITTVGYFVGGLNLIKAAQGLLAPISQVVFPRLSHLFVHAKNEAILALRKVFIFQSVLTLLMGITLFLLAPFLLPLLMGENFSDSIKVFQIMTPLIFLGGLSNLLGQQILVTLGYHRAYAVIGFCIGSIGIMLLGILGYFFYADGAAVSLVFSEILVILTMLWYLMRVEPQFFEQFKRVA
jgi:O-antigen/teichoic acid export membrane protein